MLKVRVIPVMLWKQVGLVKGVGFDSWRRVGTAMPAVKVYNTREVDELMFMDITATDEGRAPDVAAIDELAAECFVPFTVGGGIRDLETIRILLRSGADKVAINTAAYEMPDLVREASDRYGAQCVVAGIDARRDDDGSYLCYSHSGTRATQHDPITWAKELERLGAGEILLTSIERDGAMNGYDLELIERVTRSVSIPVIAQGGAGNYAHLTAAIKTGASAVAAASIFHFTEQTPAEAKAFMAKQGIPVRTTATHEPVSHDFGTF
ncbi:MAG: imidazole glycerol phosphate synthase subunit HisF [Magnetococcales bacterium]|nr:imidazole glycerol phosphate synthase subunit HisF [Magnetococcales bacterium]